ncbi:MAG TPA: alkaline phosphatase family protein [Burkholderiales bacterium]|nr:alkaline phosphatase family protein [Burkholderiales bacterium]
MEARVLPAYGGGSLVNLVASLVEARGGPPRHPRLALLEPRELERARNVVLVILDGLGDNYLMRQGKGGELARRRRGALTSVFPSTTASAITTSYTGCTPVEHGITGWYTYFGEAGYVAAPLPFRTRGDMLPLREKGFTPERAFTARPIFERMQARAIIVSSAEIIASEYNLYHCAAAERRAYDSLERFVAEVEAAVKSGPERKFIYAYWPAYDATSHRYGSLSAEAAREFERIDAAFGDLLRRLSGTETTVVATADHGFIDVPLEASLELPASLAAMLRFPLCGERRVAYCHVHDSDAFAQKARDWLGERAEVKPSAQLVREGWFGPGEAHPRFAERVGDVALVMNARYTVKDWTAGEARHLHIGNHGGPTADEMMIPLIVETA